jgi:hypothetical protein
VIVRRPDAGIDRIADATGATLVAIGPGEDPWAAGARAARRDWLLCLQDGDMPAEGWIRAVDRFALTAAGSGFPLGRLSRPRSWRERVAMLGEGRLRAPRIRPGDLVHRSRLSGPERVVRLPAQILRDPG